MLAAPIRQSVRETKPELGRRPPDATPLAIPQTPNCIEPTRAVAVAHLDGPPTLAGAEANVPVVKATDATSVLLELPVPRGKLTEAHRERPPEPVTRQEPQQSDAPIAPPVPMAVPPVTAPVKQIEVAKKELPGAVPVIAPTGMMPVEIPTVVPPRNNQPAVPNPMPTFGELGTITESQPVAVQVPMQPVVDVRLREKPVKLQSEMPSPAVPVKVNPAITVPVAAIPRAVEHDREPTMELPVQMSEPAIQVKSIPSDSLPAHAPEARMEQPSSAPALSHAVTPLPEKPEHLQQMRTFSLEFSPEGAAGDPSRDVRLHVTQRSGDVHISVDSNDTSLSNKLRDGVQDLVGHMTQAGYEADAWSQSGGERRRAPEPEPETKPVINKDATDGIAFEQLFQGKEIL